MTFDEMLIELYKQNPSLGKELIKSRIMSEGFELGTQDCMRRLREANKLIEWRSAQSDPPERGERVIVTDGVFSGEAYLNSNGKWIRYCGSLYGDGDLEELLGIKIANWMPMPVAPKKEEK